MRRFERDGVGSRLGFGEVEAPFVAPMRLAMNGDAVTGAPYEELLAGAGAHSAAAIGDPVHAFDAARSVDDLPADPAGFSTGGVL